MAAAWSTDQPSALGLRWKRAENATQKHDASRDAEQWSKVLWRKQAFPDNHVPETFLQDLRTNTELRLASLYELVVLSMPISQQLLSVILFVGLFVHLLTGSIGPQTVLVGTAAQGTSLGLVILCLVILAISPVLRTLTESTTSDSIWALSAFLFLLNLALADYSSTPIRAPEPASPSTSSTTLSQTLSLNAAICASVVLASRLQTNIEVFALLILAIVLFGLFPIFRRHLSTTIAARTTATTTQSKFHPSDLVNSLILCILYIAAVSVMWPISIATVALTTASTLFLSAVSPAWIKWAQTWKYEIKGPWDPAEPVISSSL
ncbi:phosphatidylinositol N-acetylglucosaminyltransferase [Testicularia cyperi]|uniref:Phosphatidylinositol N-acetylglucosaminyltransferase n=1 Tax=Testicularia cyperi TaxID=1882483 RepID=A0A317XL61_9BASI|nr:phosphatidylinositol N-acetylglucosaminyltransferase [Testicularia cyperi]